MLPNKLTQQPLTGIAAFEKTLADLQPVGESQELWFKQGHSNFIVTDSFDPHGSCWETQGKDTDRQRGKKHPDLYAYLKKQAETKDGGVFLIHSQPQGYPLKECVQVSDNIAAELDHGTPEEQWEKISQFVYLSGLKFRKIITSGGKSYHGHLQGTEHFPIEQTVYLRRLLAIALMSDPAACNPHQPMRVDGFDRNENGTLKGHQTRIYSGEERYTYEEFLTGFKLYFEAVGLTIPEAITDEWWGVLKRQIRNQDLAGLTKELAQGLAQFEQEKEAARLRKEKLRQDRMKLWGNQPVTDGLNRSISDCVEEACTLNSDRVLADIGWDIGDRRGCCPFHDSQSGNSAWVNEFSNGRLSFHCPTCTGEKGVDIFQVWLRRETGSFEYPQGVEYVELARDFCELAGITLPEQEKWEAVESDKKTIDTESTPTDTNGKTAPASNSAKATANLTLKLKLIQIYHQHLNEAELVIALAGIAKETRHPLPTINDIYKSISKGEDKKDRRESDQNEINKIRQASGATLPLELVLVNELATTLNGYAKYLCLRPEVLLTALLCGVSAVHHVETRIQANDDWELAPNLWGAMVAKSAQSKSPAAVGIIKKPMAGLQNQTQLEFETKTQAYKQAKAEYEALKGEDRLAAFPDGPPDPPTRPRTFYFSEATFEGIYQQFTAQEHGLLVAADELSGWFDAMNQYKGGKGNDRTRALEMKDAQDTYIGRAGGGQLIKHLVSVWGGIQPKVLEGLFKSSNGDADGTWGRFLMVEQPFSWMNIDPNRRPVSITPKLTPIYEAIHTKTDRTFYLSDGAYAVMAEANRNWGERAAEYQDHPISNIYGKARGVAIQLAFNLHCLNHAACGIAIPQEISADTMRAGVMLAEFYALQTYSLYSRFMGGTETALPAKVARVLDLALASPDHTITAKIVSNRSKVTATSAEAIELFKEMEQLELGTMTKVGKSYKFTAYPQKVESTLIFENRHRIDTESTPPYRGLKLINNKDYSHFVNQIDTIDTDPPPLAGITHQNLPADPPPVSEKSSIGVDSVDSQPDFSETLTQQPFDNSSIGVDSVSIPVSIGFSQVSILPDNPKKSLSTLFDTDIDTLVSILETNRMETATPAHEYYLDIEGLLTDYLAESSVPVPYPHPLPVEVRQGCLEALTVAFSMTTPH
jgi:hypothetical protein